MDDNFILLRNHRLFQKLTNQECRELSLEEGFIKAKKNEFIYLNELQSTRLYFLKKGYVKIGHYDKEGKEVVTEILQEGDIFGQLNLESESSEEEFAQAIKKDASICSFHVHDFEKILEKRPDLAISYTKLVGFKFKSLRNRVWNIMYKDVRERLVDFFIYVASKNNPNNLDDISIDNFLTHADVASLIGSTRQTVTTLINELSEKNLIHFDRHFIQIPSIQVLKKISENFNRMSGR
ncbi:MAG: Crp/Fnr family transcriptional regulator [Cytophagales bacterium]|nr:Crp/Fnr family transcriptional regulator [Cytophaga sp.]